MLEMHANEQIEQDAVYAGDIVAAVVGPGPTRGHDYLPPSLSKT